MYVGTAWSVLTLDFGPALRSWQRGGHSLACESFCQRHRTSNRSGWTAWAKDRGTSNETIWWIYNLQTFHQEQDLFVLQVLHSVHAVHASHTQFTWYSDVMLSPRDAPRPEKMRQAACCRMVCVKQAPRFLTTGSNTAVVSILRPQPYPRSSECQDCNFGSPPKTSTFPHSVNSTQPAWRYWNSELIWCHSTHHR